MIEIRSLSFTYAGSSRPALKNVSLSISEGEYVALAGANGSGKSTLVRCLNGLLSPPPGSVRVDGLDPSNPEERRRVRRRLALVFQSPPDQIVASVVDEDAAFGLENLGVPRDEMAVRVGRALAAVGLLEQRARQTRFLSAGQQQRLAVAGAVAMRPRYIAFDEATSMIDPAGRADILALMDSIAASGSGVLHVTHDMDEAARASRVLALSEGRLAFDGKPAQLFRRPDLAALGLAHPRSWRLALDLGLDPAAGEDAESLGRRAASAFGPAPAAVEGELPPPARPQAPGEPAFRLEAAGVHYLKGTIHEKIALREATLDIPRGSVVALVGATGSGKSTLLRLLDALVFPDPGRVVSQGVDTSDPGADVRRLRMRSPLAVQRPESALFEYYAGDEVSFGPRNQGLSGRPLVSRVEEAMEAVDLSFPEFRDRPSRSLSGGEKRRLALASVLAMDPEAILLDEPGAALDPVSRRTLLDRVLSFAGKEKTLVFATHSMEEAARADMVAVLVEGRIEAAGAPGSIFGSGWREEWGLERPFAARAAEAARRAGFPVPRWIVDDEGLLRAIRGPAAVARAEGGGVR